MPYVKLDVGVIDSTLWVDLDATRLFLTALCKAEPWEFTEPQTAIAVDTLEPSGFVVPPGWYGFARVAGVGLISTARLEHAAGMAALKRLGDVDRESRSDKWEGRRLVRINGGYVVLNFYEFRDRDYTTAARSRRYRERQRKAKAAAAPPEPAAGDASRRDVTASRRDITQAEADADAVKSSPAAPLRSAAGVVDESTTPGTADASNGETPPADPGLFGDQPTKPPKRALCPIDAIVALYHEILPNNPRCLKMTTARRSAITARWREDLTDLDDWRQFFTDVAADPFYRGRNERHWYATLHWLTKADNFAKVAERHDMPRNRRR